MGDILAIAEQRDGKIRGVSREVVTAAAALTGELGGAAHVLVIGGGGLSGSAGDLGRYGATRIRVAEQAVLGDFNPHAYAPIIAQEVKSGGYDVVLFGATAQGKDLAPRVAALLDVPLAADVTGLEGTGGELVATRPVYSGKAFAKVSFDAAPAMVSIRPNVFQAVESGGSADVEAFAPEVDAGAGGYRLVEFQAVGGGTKDVAEAGIVVSGGRGMKDPENWGLLEDLREAMGPDTALGASRAAVDAGWRSHGEQVGQTGKTVAPKLYVAIGISGAIQHLAGMRTSGTIVAVNKDPDAPIFATADYGIVGDLFEVVPKLTEEIRALKAGD
jgi:electron transfer flavoprotein alpha subunit